VPWYNYIASFFAGMFLANVMPHFVHGISGDPFPTPFSKPPGKGLSSPTVNVVWALFHLVIGYFLFQAGKIASGERLTLLILFSGIVVIRIMGSRSFATKHTR
jgi:small-conductance mechanosensitive channel